MGTVYVRFVRVYQNDDSPSATETTQLLSHATIPDTTVPRTGDYIDVPDNNGGGLHSVVEKVTWFYTKDYGGNDHRTVDAVWVQVSPK